MQRSRNNLVSANLVIGGESGVEFSEECRREDMVNDIRGNIFSGTEDAESLEEEFGKVYPDRTEIADGFRSLTSEAGSRFVPDGDLMELYMSGK